MYDVIWLVKRHNKNYIHVRNHCRYLICDPLDFWHSPTRANPATCWRELYDAMPFDAIVATSPACRRAMQEALKGIDVPIHMLPHQCDPRVNQGWYDPDGPIVYGGSRGFINAYVETIEAACSLIGREFRVDYSQHHGCRVLEGASLVLALRAGRSYSCEFTRHCKPQIKIENAAAMGAPVLCSGHPAETSLHPECCVALQEEFLGNGRERDVWIAGQIAGALVSLPPSTCYRQWHFFADVFNVIESRGTDMEIVNYGEAVDRQTVTS